MTLSHKKGEAARRCYERLLLVQAKMLMLIAIPIKIGMSLRSICLLPFYLFAAGFLPRFFFHFLVGVHQKFYPAILRGAIIGVVAVFGCALAVGFG